MRVQLVSGYTRKLKHMFARGDCDFILTTEDGLDPGGETLAVKKLVWLGAPGGSAWRERPLRLAFCTFCIFRTGVQRQLDEAGIPWEMAVESDSERTVEATVSADLAVSVMIQGTEPPYTEVIQHGGALPEMKSQNINLYASEAARGPAAEAMAQLIRSRIRTI
jgi:DNA-binding transcriptional LysR family regulator